LYLSDETVLDDVLLDSYFFSSYFKVSPPFTWILIMVIFISLFFSFKSWKPNFTWKSEDQSPGLHYCYHENEKYWKIENIQGSWTSFLNVN